jgi:hypothetical protein
MTTKDKTGDRLVASIRRTRAGAGKPAGKPAQRPVPARKPRAAAKKGATRPAQGGAAEKPDAARDNYRSGGRVWPD